MRHFFSALIVILALPMASYAQQASPRATYNAARAEMDTRIMARQMGDAIRMFQGLGVPDDAELASLDVQIQALYPDDFENVALIRSEVIQNGFRQELIAYWTETQYLYVYLLIHTDDNHPRLLNFQFDSDFHALNALF